MLGGLPPPPPQYQTCLLKSICQAVVFSFNHDACIQTEYFSQCQWKRSSGLLINTSSHVVLFIFCSPSQWEKDFGSSHKYIFEVNTVVGHGMFFIYPCCTWKPFHTHTFNLSSSHNTLLCYSKLKHSTVCDMNLQGHALNNINSRDAGLWVQYSHKHHLKLAMLWCMFHQWHAIYPTMGSCPKQPRGMMSPALFRCRISRHTQTVERTEKKNLSILLHE